MKQCIEKYNYKYNNILLHYNIQHIFNTNVNTIQYNMYEVYKYTLYR